MTTAAPVYVPRPIKRTRRTATEMRAFYKALYAVLEAQQPMTVRQVFYQAEVRGLVEKTEGGYMKTQRALLALRKDGLLPWGWIVDNTRWQIKPESYDRMEDAIRAAAASYRRAVWNGRDQRLEFWCEKDALSGVISEVTEDYDVPLLISRGYSSVTFVHSAAEAICRRYERGITTWVYHLGDYDPSGQDAARDIREKLTGFSPPDSFVFQQLAVMPDQISAWNLPTRPTKATDTRAPGFGADSVELDAIPPDVLRDLVRDTIEAHLPPGYMDDIRFAEEEERRSFKQTFGPLMAG